MQVDVIAQWNHDGSIVPLRLRIYEEEAGEYTIKNFRVVEHDTGDLHGMFVREADMAWECKIVVFGAEKSVWLVWNGRKWMLGDGPMRAGPFSVTEAGALFGGLLAAVILVLSRNPVNSSPPRLILFIHTYFF